MKTEEKSVFYQILDRYRRPASDLIYTNLELAEEHCYNLIKNYREWHGVQEVFIRNK